MTRSRIYLDHNATAPLLTVARDAMIEALELCGNPSSVHREGRAARSLIDQARRRVADLVGADSSGVIFTSGATEAAATVLTPRFKMGKVDLAVERLFTGAADHPCVLAGGRFGTERTTTIPVNADGHVDVDALERMLADHDRETGLAMVCMTLANNETGIIQPMDGITGVVKGHGGILVIDAVQAAGRMLVDIETLGADFLILSSHKIGGPKGAGALISAGEIMMPQPLIPGGGQEKGHRSGTENPAAVAGFGAAADHVRIGLDDYREPASALRDRLETGLVEICPECTVYGAAVSRLPNTSFFSIPDMKAETVQIAFDLEGIAVSAGSACSSGKVGPSHVLAAMGYDADTGGIRVSLGRDTTEADIDAFLTTFAKIVRKRVPAPETAGA